MASEDQAAWVLRVLGFALPSVGTNPAAPPTSRSGDRMSANELLVMFRDAKGEVDAGLNKLQGELRDTGDEDLVRIADFGTFGMTNGQGVGLLKALFDLRGATPASQEALSKAARNAATAYKAAVFSHAMVDLVDANPFGVDVGIKARLGPTLDTIARAA